MDWTILWWVLACLVIIAGLAGTVVPALPGVPLVFLGLFIGAWIGNFEIIGWGTVGILGALALIAWVVDFLAGAAGARYLGASSRAFWGATIGAVVEYSLVSSVCCWARLSAPYWVSLAAETAWFSPAGHGSAQG